MRSVLHAGLVLAMLSVPAAVRAGAPGRLRSWDAEDIEAPAGEGFLLFLNPADEILGFSGNAGMWVRDTPVFGDYFAQLFWNGIENAVYAGLGMTIRLMPHTSVAPFVGAGGCYNQSLSSSGVAGDPEETEEDELDNRGASYWGGHVETGVRVTTGNRWSMFEVLVRYTWSSLEGERDTWIVAIGSGTGRSSPWDW